jgi:6-phosphogluconolactonase
MDGGAGSNGAGGGGRMTGGSTTGANVPDAAGDSGDVAVPSQNPMVDAMVDAPVVDAPTPTTSFVYVSGYAEPITVFTLNTATGVLTPASTASTGPGGQPTSLAFSPDKRTVYAGDEQKDLPMSRVIAFAINQATGALTELNRQGTGGTTLAHVSVHPSGKWVLSANYGTGDVTVFPVRPDGGIGAGMPRVPAGEQAHYILFDATGQFLFVPCLASHHVAMFRFADGVLTPNDPPTVPVTGSPRHLVFSPDQRFVYALTQNESIILSFTFDRTTGRLTPLETINATPTPSLGAHIAVHPSGRFLYASNRSDNSVAIFTVDATSGRLSRVGYQRDMIAYPWWFSIDTTGQLLLVASDRSATVAVHRIDQTMGTLQRLGMPATVAMRPTFVGVLSLP